MKIGWDFLENKNEPTGIDKRAHMEAIAKMTLNTSNGRELMMYLHEMTTKKVLPFNADDKEIRYCEGMRFIVNHLENLIKI